MVDTCPKYLKRDDNGCLERIKKVKRYWVSEKKKKLLFPLDSGHIDNHNLYYDSTFNFRQKCNSVNSIGVIYTSFRRSLYVHAVDIINKFYKK